MDVLQCKQPDIRGRVISRLQLCQFHNATMQSFDSTALAFRNTKFNPHPGFSAFFVRRRQTSSTRRGLSVLLSSTSQRFADAIQAMLWVTASNFQLSGILVSSFLFTKVQGIEGSHNTWYGVHVLSGQDERLLLTAVSRVLAGGTRETRRRPFSTTNAAIKSSKSQDCGLSLTTSPLDLSPVMNSPGHVCGSPMLADVALAT